MRLEDFSVKGEKDTKGDFTPVISIKIDYAGVNEAQGKNITAWIVSNGKIVWEEKGICPFSFDYRDTSYAENADSGGKVYYRLDISDEDGCHIISNPIFVNY